MPISKQEEIDIKNNGRSTYLHAQVAGKCANAVKSCPAQQCAGGSHFSAALPEVLREIFNYDYILLPSSVSYCCKGNDSFSSQPSST